MIEYTNGVVVKDSPILIRAKLTPLNGQQDGETSGPFMITYYAVAGSRLVPIIGGIAGDPLTCARGENFCGAYITAEMGCRAIARSSTRRNGSVFIPKIADGRLREIEVPVGEAHGASKSPEYSVA
jgi:hypothetical protein